jgi:hypothetical protein
VKLLPTLLVLAVALSAHADETTRREIRAVRVTVPPKIDGSLDDPCWKEMPSSSGFTDQTLGTAVGNDTTVWIGYDDKHIYVAFHCQESQPKRIVARETKRGAGFTGEDYVRLRLNLFNTRRPEEESRLDVNPLGTQTASFAGGRALKQEWEGFWQSAARVVEDGWTAELAIPWRSFTRPAATGQPVTVGVNFERYQAHTQVISQWSNLGPQQRRELGGQWIGVVLPPADGVNPLSVLGYSYGGYDREDIAGRMGLDARYQFTPAFTGLFAYNPDFSNIEQAVTSIDFSYAERLPLETRPFFQEGGRYFFAVPDLTSPFTSVRIPQFAEGAKFFGRVGSATDLGILSTQSYSGRNDTALNVRHHLSPFDVLALRAVSRMERGIDNQVLVGYAAFQRGDWTLQQSYGRSADRTGRGEYGTSFLFWNSKAWSADAYWHWISPGYVARDGFVPFVNQKGLQASLAYNTEWRSGPIRSLAAVAYAYQFEHYDGSPYRDQKLVGLSLRNERDLAMELAYNVGRFERNRDRLLNVGLRYPALNRYQNYGITYASGRQGGEEYSAIGAQVNWRFFHGLTIGASSEIVRLAGTDQQHILTLNYDIARDQAIGGRVLVRGNKTNGYLSFRQSGYGGTEWFVIAGDPNALTFQNRLIFKVVRPM